MRQETLAGGRLVLEPASDGNAVLIVDGHSGTVSVHSDENGIWRAYDGMKLVAVGSPNYVKQKLVRLYGSDNTFGDRFVPAILRARRGETVVVGTDTEMVEWSVSLSIDPPKLQFLCQLVGALAEMNVEIARGAHGDMVVKPISRARVDRVNAEASDTVTGNMVAAMALVPDLGCDAWVCTDEDYRIWCGGCSDAELIRALDQYGMTVRHRDGATYVGPVNEQD